MVDLKTLKQLIKMMVDNDLTELDIKTEDGPIKLKRNSQSSGGVQMVPVAQPAAPAPAPEPARAESSRGGLFTINKLIHRVAGNGPRMVVSKLQVISSASVSCGGSCARRESFCGLRRTCRDRIP